MASGASRRGSEVTRAAGVHGLRDVDPGTGRGVDWGVWLVPLSVEGTGAIKGVEGEGEDTLDRGEGRRVEMIMMRVATCHGMVAFMHKGKVQGGSGRAVMALNHARGGF